MHIHFPVIYFTKWNIDVPSKGSILLTACFTDNSTLPAICSSQDVWRDKYLKSNLAKRQRWMCHPGLSWEPRTLKYKGRPCLNCVHTHTHTHRCTKATRYLQNISQTCHRGYTAAPNYKFLYVLIVGDGVPTMLWASVGVFRAEKCEIGGLCNTWNV